MPVSPAGLRFIKAEEGTVLKAYRDVGGVWTIGTGHTAAAGGLKPVAGMTITPKQATALLAEDLKKFEARVKKYLGPNQPQHVIDGAVSFDFNTGAIHLASWVDAFLAGDMKTAETKFKLYNKAGGRTIAGLVARRNREADIIFRNRYPYSGKGAESPSTYNAGVEQIKEAQTLLAALGYDPGPADGIAGRKTKAAVIRFQQDTGLKADGIIGPATLATLRRQKASNGYIKTTGAVAAGGAAATVAGKETILSYDWMTLATVLLAGVVVIGLAFAVWHFRGSIIAKIKGTK